MTTANQVSKQLKGKATIDQIIRAKAIAICILEIARIDTPSLMKAGHINENMKVYRKLR